MSTLFTRKEIAERLNITEESVRSLYRKGLIPVIRLGHKTVRFDPAEVDKAIQKLSSAKEDK